MIKTFFLIGFSLSLGIGLGIALITAISWLLINWLDEFF